MKLQKIIDSIYNVIMGNKMLRESIASLVLVFSFVPLHVRGDKTWLETSLPAHFLPWAETTDSIEEEVGG